MSALNVFFVGLYLAAAAKATSVYIQFDSTYSTPETVDRTVDGGANWFGQEPGQFHFFTESGSPSDIPAQFYTFCIEPREFISPGQLVTYNLVPVDQGTTNIGGMGTAKAALIEELLYENYPDFSVALDVQHAAAIQVALWKIVRENQQGIGTWDLSSGDVQYRNWSDTTVRDLAASMLGALTGQGPYLTNIDALAVVGTQDTLVQLTSSVPEPATCFLTGAALALLGARFRRKR
jgi:hypothetical protein